MKRGAIAREKLILEFLSSNVRDFNTLAWNYAWDAHEMGLIEFHSQSIVNDKTLAQIKNKLFDTSLNTTVGKITRTK